MAHVGNAATNYGLKFREFVQRTKRGWRSVVTRVAISVLMCVTRVPSLITRVPAVLWDSNIPIAAGLGVLPSLAGSASHISPTAKHLLFMKNIHLNMFSAQACKNMCIIQNRYASYACVVLRSAMVPWVTTKWDSDNSGTLQIFAIIKDLQNCM